jgi:hypothetical protein
MSLYHSHKTVTHLNKGSYEPVSLTRYVKQYIKQDIYIFCIEKRFQIILLFSYPDAVKSDKKYSRHTGIKLWYGKY